MKRIVILCVEDEPEVRDALLRDLEPFAGAFRIEAAEDAEDAREVVDKCLSQGNELGLVLCDHVLPGEKQGVDFLVELNNDKRTAAARNILVTGQAGLNETITAVNAADLDFFMPKPWSPDGLQEVVRKYLTSYVIDQVRDILAYVDILDRPRILEAHDRRQSEDFFF
jgi:two-component system chemotaxis response regulator CheY